MLPLRDYPDPLDDGPRPELWAAVADLDSPTAIDPVVLVTFRDSWTCPALGAPLLRRAKGALGAMRVVLAYRDGGGDVRHYGDEADSAVVRYLDLDAQAWVRLD